MSRVCSFCVMDDTYPGIRFDADGRCSGCIAAEADLTGAWRPSDGPARLDALLDEIRTAGVGHTYDCIIGLSGGVDSAFLLHMAVKEWDLRPLALHVDGGWNTVPSIQNIRRIIEGTYTDLMTLVIEWEEMRALQVAFLRAGVLNQDIPQDHAFFVGTFRIAMGMGIPYILSGTNLTSECMSVPSPHSHPSMDGAHLKAVARANGVTLREYPTMSIAEFLFRTRVTKQIRKRRPLDVFDYDKVGAQKMLAERYGWSEYGEKHAESYFTKFYQQVYLRRRFGFDKERLHLSSLVVAGQLSRADALEKIRERRLDERDAERQIRFVAKKLGLPVAEMEALMAVPLRSHKEFRNDGWILDLVSRVRRLRRRVA